MIYKKNATQIELQNVIEGNEKIWNGKITQTIANLIRKKKLQFKNLKTEFLQKQEEEILKNFKFVEIGYDRPLTLSLINRFKLAQLLFVEKKETTLGRTYLKLKII